jgi:hypothetical protein
MTFTDVLEYKQYYATRTHTHALYPKLPKIYCFKYSFFVRIITSWNNLPSLVVEVDIIKIFKNSLKLHSIYRVLAKKAYCN